MGRTSPRLVRQWVAEHQGKHRCRCGCGGVLLIRPHHYTRGVPQYLRGHTLKEGAATPERRFWRHGVQAGACWVWQGRLSAGYGWLRLNRTTSMRAHRFSWWLHYGPIPEGLYVCHTCDNRACVNPAHLFLGTHQDNMADMVRKGRQAVRRGEAHPRARLTRAGAEEIRRRRRSGEAVGELARAFGVSPSTIGRVLRGKAWGTHAGLECTVLFTE